MSQSRGASFDYVVVPAGPADAEALARLHVTTWRETYPGLLPDAFLARMSEPAHARRFRRALSHPPQGEVILAAMNAYGLIGYTQAGPARDRTETVGEIHTLYVLKAAQRRGVGRRLLVETARALAGQGAEHLMISVLADNAKAAGLLRADGRRRRPAAADPRAGGPALQRGGVSVAGDRAAGLNPLP